MATYTLKGKTNYGPGTFLSPSVTLPKGCTGYKITVDLADTVMANAAVDFTIMVERLLEDQTWLVDAMTRFIGGNYIPGKGYIKPHLSASWPADQTTTVRVSLSTATKIKFGASAELLGV